MNIQAQDHSAPEYALLPKGYYKIVALVLGTNIVREELGLPLAECLAADDRYSLVPTK